MSLDLFDVTVGALENEIWQDDWQRRRAETGLERRSSVG